MFDLLNAEINHGRGRSADHGSYTHPCHVLGLLARSSGGYCLNGTTRSPAKAPWMTLVPTGRKDSNFLDGPYESRYVTFKWQEFNVRELPGDKFAASLQGLRRQVAPFVELDEESAGLCAGMIEEIRGDIRSQDIGSVLKAGETFMRLLRTYLRLASVEGVATEHRELLRFRNLVIEHAFDQTPIEALSGQCKLTSDHLGRLFKLAYGVTPNAYRTGLRMEKASDLLASSSLNVGEAGRRVGYDDPLYFSRAFRRHFGFPPGKLLRAIPWPPRKNPEP